jgi:hypothetical protein
MTTAEMLRNEGEAQSVLKVLATRGVPVSEELRDRILACRDSATLDRWLSSALTATSAADVVGE